jgi:Ca2+:H+ antiporter
VLHYATGAGDVAVFAVSALALVPLAWVIGESTEHLAEHTGPGVGGFLNASFGNAPELIIAVLAVEDGLPHVVRGSITGSVVSNLLLVLGLTLVAGPGAVDRRSLLTHLGVIGVAVVVFLIPSVGGWHGSPDRHSLYLATLPVAAVLLAFYGVTSLASLRRHRAQHGSTEAAAGAWRWQTSLALLAAAAIATAFVSESLVTTLEGFGDALGLSDFFVAAVIVAIVGNAAEHGGAIVVARRGKVKLASEIAISSSARVAVFVAPAAVVISALRGNDLTLAFRPVELATSALATALVAVVVLDGRATRREGVALVVAYVAAAAAYALSGNA